MIRFTVLAIIHYWMEKKHSRRKEKLDDEDSSSDEEESKEEKEKLVDKDSSSDEKDPKEEQTTNIRKRKKVRERLSEEEVRKKQIKQRVNVLDRKEISARLTPLQIVGSFFDDFDVITDWYWIGGIAKNDEVNQLPIFKTAIVFGCLGTFLWYLSIVAFPAALENKRRLVKKNEYSKTYKFLPYTWQEKNSLLHKDWFLPALNILFEDVPQLVMTILVTLFYDPVDDLSQTTATINILTSVFATVIKILKLLENKNKLTFFSAIIMNKERLDIMEDLHRIEEASGNAHLIVHDGFGQDYSHFYFREKPHHVFEALCKDNTYSHKLIRSLGFNYCNMDGTEFKGLGIVEDLCLMQNQIGDIGAKNIAQYLSGNETLKILSIRGIEDFPQNRKRVRDIIYISHVGAVDIAESLKHNEVLLKLDLSTNNITEKGAIAIVNALKENNSLQELNIGENNISDGGAIKIANALQGNEYLQKLYLDRNMISDDGAIAIVTAVTENNVLQELDLSHNSISKKGKIAIIDYLRGLDNYPTNKRIYLAEYEGFSDEALIAAQTKLKDRHPNLLISRMEELEEGRDDGGTVS